MAILNFCGWESGDSLETQDTSGTFSVQGTVKRTGAYTLRVNPATTATGYHSFGLLNTAGAPTFFNKTNIWLTVYFRYATKPASGDEIILRVLTTAGARSFELRLNSAGKLAAYNSTPALLATGATVLAADTWYRIEVKAGTGTSAAWEVKINGVSEISGTGNLGVGAEGYVRLGKVANYNGNSVDYFYDDLCIDDAAYPGAGQVFRMDPDGDGAYTAWTGTYADVDEVPHDADTTYITSSVSGEAETVNLESAASAGLVGTPLSVKSCAIVRDEGGVSAIQVRLRSGTTDSDTDSNDPGATYILRARVYNTDPADSAAWTAAKLDALQVGVENNASVAVRCTALSVMVWEDGVVLTPKATLSGSGTLAATGQVWDAPVIGIHDIGPIPSHMQSFHRHNHRVAGRGLYVFCYDSTFLKMFRSADAPHDSWADVGNSGAHAKTFYHIDSGLDSQKVIHVVALDTDASSGSLRYCTFDCVTHTWSSWETVTADVKGGWDTFSGVGIYIDLNDKPHVVYGTWDNKLKYTEKTGASWTTPVEVYATGQQNRWPTIRIDASGVLHVVWINKTAGGVIQVLYKKKATGGWQSEETVISSICAYDGTAWYPALQFSSAGEPWVAVADYHAEAHFDPKVVKRTGGSWSASDSPSYGGYHFAVFPTLALDMWVLHDKCHLVMRSAHTGAIVCWQNGSGWRASAVPNLIQSGKGDSVTSAAFFGGRCESEYSPRHLEFAFWWEGPDVDYSGYAAMQIDWGYAIAGAAALSGSGTVTAAGSKVTVRSGAAALSGSGTASAAGVRTLPGTAALSGSGTVVAAGSTGAAVLGGASLSGSGIATAAAGLIQPASAVLAGAGAANATGVRTTRGQAAPAGAGAVSIAGRVTRNAAAAIGAEGTVAAAGRLTGVGKTVLAGSGTVAVAGQITVLSCDDQVASLGDDSYEDEGSGDQYPTATTVRVHSDVSPVLREWGGVRFEVGPFPAWKATIVAAYLELSVYDAGFDDANLDVYAEDAAAPAAFGAGNHDISGRTLTTAKVAWVSNGLGTGWIQSPSLAAVIQELVDSYEIEKLSLILKPRTDVYKAFRIRSWDGDHALAAKIHLEWNAGFRVGSASLIGVSTVSASGGAEKIGRADLTGAGTAAAAGTQTHRGTAVLSGSGTATAAGARTLPGAAILSGAGGLTASGRMIWTGKVVAAGAGTALVSGVAGRRGASALSASGTVGALGVQTHRATATLLGSGTVTAEGRRGPAGGAALAASGTVTAYATQVHRAAGAVVGTGTLTAGGARTIPGTAVLSGSGAVAAAGVSTVRAACALVGSGALAARGESAGEALGRADLSGSGTATASGRATYKGVAAASGSGLLTVAGKVTRHGAAACSASGTVLVAGRATRTSGALLSASGAASALGSMLLRGGSALSGSGSLTAQGEVGSERLGRAELAGLGTMVAVGVRKLPGAAALAGSGTAAAAGVRTRPAVAALSGSGTASAAGVRGCSGAASLAGSGTVSAAGVRAPRGAAALSGSGTLAAQAEVGGECLARAALGGSGSVVASASQTHRAIAVLSGSGAAVSGCQLTRNAAAVLAGSGTVTASAVIAVVVGQADIGGQGSVAVAGRVTRSAAATLAGAGVMEARAEVGGECLGRAILSGSGTATGAGVRTRRGVAALSGSGAATVAGMRTRSGAAALAGSGTATGSGMRTVAAACALAGAGTVVVQGEMGSERLGRADLSGTGTVIAHGTQTHRATVALSGSGAATAAGVRTRRGAAALSGTGALAAQAEVGSERLGRADLSGAGSVAVSALVTRQAVATLSSAGAAVAGAQVLAVGRVALSGSGVLAASGRRIVAAAASLAGRGTVIAVGRAASFRVIDVDGRADTAFAVEGGVEMAVMANVEFYRGEDITITVTMPEGSDITSWDLEADVRVEAGEPDPPLLEKTSAPSGGIAKLDARSFRIVIESEDTEDVAATMYAWSARRTDEGAEAVLVCGNLNLKECA